MIGNLELLVTAQKHISVIGIRTLLKGATVTSPPPLSQQADQKYLYLFLSRWIQIPEISVSHGGEYEDTLSATSLRVVSYKFTDVSEVIFVYVDVVRIYL
jgi:hypothetical protein